MTVKIDGTDITKYIARGGFKWTRNDIDAPGSGRAIDGTMQRGRVATKIKLEITCRPLKKDEIQHLFQLIQPEFVSVTYDDPLYGEVTKTMYANNNAATYEMMWVSGIEWYTGVTFPLVER